MRRNRKTLKDNKVAIERIVALAVMEMRVGVTTELWDVEQGGEVDFWKSLQKKITVNLGMNRHRRRKEQSMRNELKLSKTKKALETP